MGLLATHPVQYYAPWYRRLARDLDLDVFYCHRQTPEGQRDAGFSVGFEWDIPLLEGYRYRFLTNRARRPDVSTFFGCDTPEIADIIRRERFDAFIVHGWATKGFWQAIWACWQSATAVLVRGDSQLPTRRPGWWRLAKYFIYRSFVPRFDGYLVVGQRARQYLLHYGADPGRMFPVPHAVDNEFFASRAEAARGQRGAIRAAWGIPAGAVVFVFSGKFIPKKRPEDFARAVGETARRAPRVWGLMVGDGPLRPMLEAAARQDAWPVRFAGFLNQTQMPGAYAAGDALVLPSDSGETWGLVVNEAMASGLPAVVSDEVGCGPDLVHPSSTGETFRCGHIRELASILTDLAGDPSRLARLGLAARRHVQRYSLDAAARGTLAAVESIRRRGSVEALGEEVGRLVRSNLDDA